MNGILRIATHLNTSLRKNCLSFDLFGMKIRYEFSKDYVNEKPERAIDGSTYKTYLAGRTRRVKVKGRWINRWKGVIMNLKMQFKIS